MGMQTNRPLKRGVNPFGGIRMARQACEAYGYKLGDGIEKQFKYRTTHNDGVFKAYTEEMRKGAPQPPYNRVCPTPTAEAEL